MSSLHRGLLAITLAFGAAWGCTESASIDNDKKGSNIAKRDAGSDDDAVVEEESESDSEDDSSGDDSEDDDTSNDESVDDDAPAVKDAGGKDAGGGSDEDDDEPEDEPDQTEMDAGTTKPDASKPATSTIKGTATAKKCTSFGTAKNGMCGSYYCGVTEEQIMSELPADSLCPDPAQICDGRLVRVVGNCARTTKAANLAANNVQLKPKVAACVQKDPEFTDLPMDCLGCFLDVALCAGDKCLLECLTGDSVGCDACRMRNNCEAPVFSCAKIPNPL